jgi:hypothetical protein
MALQVLVPARENVCSQSLQAQDIVRVKLGRALLLPKAFLQQLFYIVAMRRGGQMLEEP